MHLRRVIFFILIFLLLVSCNPVEEVSVQSATASPSPQPTQSPPFYPIVETGLQYCYNFLGLFACPSEGEVLFGQDANYLGLSFDYVDNTDGTVSDNHTKLMWQQVQSSKRSTLNEAEQICRDLELAGHQDWRLPSIHELFSIADLSGGRSVKFYIKSDFLELRYGDPTGTYWGGESFELSGQTWSSTPTEDTDRAYTFNFFDGELRAYDNQEQFFTRCVRGAQYGNNDLVDQGDGTILDQASGLTWQKETGAFPTNWGGALNYCESLELGGMDDWRLPDTKELFSISQSIIESGLFTINENAERLWSSTTREDFSREAYYLCLENCSKVNDPQEFGAGSLRSEPKYGEVADYPGRDVQVIINNYVLCVQGGSVRPINGPYTVDSNEERLLLDLAVAAQTLGINYDDLQNALLTNSPTDPQVQKAAYALGIDLEELRAVVQDSMFVATPLPST